MKLTKKNILEKFNKKEVNFITIDGITCSGKSLFADLLKKKLNSRFKNILILSKDLFLLTREKRIYFTKKTKKNFFNQNKIHYDLNKLNTLIRFLKKGNKNKTLIIKNLYNRKTGQNNQLKPKNSPFLDESQNATMQSRKKCVINFTLI